MPTYEEFFNVVENARVFNTLELRSKYYQLPLSFGDKVKTTF